MASLCLQYDSGLNLTMIDFVGEKSVRRDEQDRRILSPYGEKTDLAALHDLWHEPAYDEKGNFKYGYYCPDQLGRTVDILVGGRYFECQASELRLDDSPVSKKVGTDRRIITEIASDLNRTSDCKMVLFQGFCETTAQTEGTELVALLKALMGKGYKNPSVLGVNLSGRGTEIYAKKRDVLSTVRLEDQLGDSAVMMRALIGSRKLNAETIVLCGHSMGFGDAMAAYEEFDRIQGINDISRDVFERIRTVVGLMPAFGERASCLRLPKFWQVAFSMMPFSLWNTVGLGKKALEFSTAFYGENMSGNSVEDFDDELWKRGVGDSAYRFLDLVMQFSRRFSGAVKAMAKNKVNVHLLGSEKDALFGLKICKDLETYLRSAGVEVDLTESQMLPHTPAFRPDKDQAGELESFFSGSLSREGDSN